MDPATATLLVGGASAAANYFGSKSANSANADQFWQQLHQQNVIAHHGVEIRAKDMERAGLNRMLAAGDAASQGSVSPPTMQNQNESAASSAKEAMMMFQQAKKIKSEVDLINAQKKATETNEKVARGGIPEAEAKEGVWNYIKKKGGAVLDKFINGSQSNAKKSKNQISGEDLRDNRY